MLLIAKGWDKTFSTLWRHPIVRVRSPSLSLLTHTQNPGARTRWILLLSKTNTGGSGGSLDTVRGRLFCVRDDTDICACILDKIKYKLLLAYLLLARFGICDGSSLNAGGVQCREGRQRRGAMDDAGSYSWLRQKR